MFQHMSCAVVSLDAMDVSGENHLDVVSERTPTPEKLNAAPKFLRRGG